MDPTQKKQLTIATLNTRGLNRHKVGSIRRIISDENTCISILCIQETHKKQDKFIKFMEKKLNVDIFVTEGSSHARGVMIFINKRSNIKVKRIVYKDNEGNVLILEIIIDEKPVLLTNYYGPIKDKCQSGTLQEIEKIFMKEKQREIILIGDFNMVEDASKDRNHTITKSETKHNGAKKAIQRIKERFKMEDIFRNRSPDLQKFTFRRLYRNVKSRLDRAYVTKGILKNVFYDDMKVFIHSDHD